MPPVAVHVTAELYAPAPVTVAAHVAVCDVVMEDGVATTVTAVTDGLVPGVETETVVIPNFAASCVDVALMVSDAEPETADGAV